MLVKSPIKTIRTSQMSYELWNSMEAIDRKNNDSQGL